MRVDLSSRRESFVAVLSEEAVPEEPRSSGGSPILGLRGAKSADLVRTKIGIIMEYHLPMSNTKINRFPILPPIITNDITTEIQYYKQLAIAVEERLKALELARVASLEKNIQEPNFNGVRATKENGVVSTDFSFKINDCHGKDMPFSMDVTMDYPTKDKPEENLIDIGTPVSEKIANNTSIDKNDNIFEQKYNNVEEINKPTSEDEKSCLNDTLLCNSVSSDTITISTDINQYLNTSASIKTDTTDTTPENWKSQVPKTLNIIPITVDKVKCSDISNDDETPKLVRRGSYVLDAPSPMLLALMNNESTNTERKASTSSIQSIKYKEYNSNGIKTNREIHNKFKEPISFRVSSTNKIRKSNYTHIPSQRVCRSVSNSKTCSPLDVCQPTKSVDCIQAMFTKELYSPKTAVNKTTNISKIYSPPVNGTNCIRHHSSKKTIKNTSILNLANKLSGSLGSLSSVSPKPVKRVERKSSTDSNSEKSFNPDSRKSNISSTCQQKRKPIITSEKIVTVFREIQDTHKKQMIELMTRQQKEQVTMQEDFKKQQILLLAQIRKAFPEISISALSEAITGKIVENKTPPSSEKSSSKRSEPIKPPQSIEKSQANEINNDKKKEEAAVAQLPTNCTHQSKELLTTSCHLMTQTTPTVCPNYEINYQLNENKNDAIFNNRFQLSNVRIIDDIPVGNIGRRHSTVSRQLFPLDNKSNRVDNSIYTEKHTKAATVINAHAKGFLVRRLMKTEKIIALKNTYKEALYCMLRLHVDEPLQVPEVKFKKRLQQQCDAASMSIVNLFSQDPYVRMEIIAHDREIKTARADRPSSARSYSFATQRTLARKKMKDDVPCESKRAKMGVHPSLQGSMMSRSCPVRTRCQTWASTCKERKTTVSLINQGIKRSTSAGAVRKPWR